jgi:Anti-sigma-K factor rskA
MPVRRSGDDEAAELAALADGSLAPARRASLEARVAASPKLAERLAEQQQAVVLARTAVQDVEAPERLRRRIEARRGARVGRGRRRLVFVTVGTAAVAAVVIGLTVFNSSSGYGAPFRAALEPTGLSPAARGEATLTRSPSGWRVALDATGLPRLDKGRFYEAWLGNAAGVLVPIGTFNAGRDVTLWAGVSPTDFTTLTVTRERAGGDQDSSGEKVLVGAVTAGR